ncbi:hypothetical protein A0H76_836 [Hepatospora eriocheir]|uniref:SKP1 component POZ domain-containing protein n=1 Tax=Hepatospora eriocheir TaxID=1081669 RepID=A0A1X0Q6M9_9MICR|nr:hypothetical protein A0H76_836 [Hepatospora eriocheir]
MIKKIKMITKDKTVLPVGYKSFNKFRMICKMIELHPLDQNYEFEIPFDSKTLLQVCDFAANDNVKLVKNYNPINIHFKNDVVQKLENHSFETLVSILSLAMYLDYPFLSELIGKLISIKLSPLPKTDLLKYTQFNVEKCDNEE